MFSTVSHGGGRSRWSTRDRRAGAWRRHLRGWLALGLALISAAGAAAATLTVQLPSTNLVVGQTVQLQLVFEGGQPQAVPPLNVPGLSVAYVGASQINQVINGQVLNQIILNYQLTPQQPGNFVIPAVAAMVGNQRIVSQPVALAVGQMDAARLNQLAFVQLSLPKTNLYAGECAVMTVEVYAIAQQEGQPELAAKGFTPGPWAAQRPQVVNFGGRQMALHRYQATVVPIQPGRFELGPVRFTARVPAPNARRSFFGDILDWQNLAITNAPVFVNVLPLPATNVPPQFTGAIGRLAMTATASPTNVAVGDPITVKVEVSGDLPLDGLRLPDQPAWREFKVYPPVSKLENVGQFGLGGRKIFEQVVVPQSTELRRLPGVQFAFFDPNLRSYRVLTGPELPLIVRPSAGAQPVAMVEDTNTVSLVPIKPHLGQVAPPAAPLLTQAWFLALQLVPVAAWLGLLLRRRQLEQLANNPRLRRRRDVDRMIARGLEELPALAKPAQAQEFYAAIFRLLQERLGERLDLPASAITESVIEERLRPAGVDARLIENLGQLFQVCNQARYAPRATPAEFAELKAKTVAVLADLDKILPEGGAR